MGDYIHGVKYHEVKSTVVKYNVSLLTRQDLEHSISAQGKQSASLLGMLSHIHNTRLLY